MKVRAGDVKMMIAGKSGRWSCTPMMCIAFVAMSCDDISEARQPATPPTPAVQVRVTTITAFTVPLVGQPVRVVDGVVSRVASPRLVIVSSSTPHVPLGADSVAVIVESGSAMITAGEQVMVTGVVHGFVAQQEDVGRPLIGALTMEERDALRKRPLVIVSSATSFVKR
jgi:hypothetical protein